MRFDIVLNDLCALAWTKHKIAMISDGSPWRPIVHIEDICEAMRCAVEAPADAVNGEVFNVGATEENYRMREIARDRRRRISRLRSHDRDRRGTTTAAIASSFDKIATRLPRFKSRVDCARGRRNCASCSSASRCPRETYEFRAFTRLKQLNYLQRTGQVDEDLFWSR